MTKADKQTCWCGLVGLIVAGVMVTNWRSDHAAEKARLLSLVHLAGQQYSEPRSYLEQRMSSAGPNGAGTGANETSVGVNAWTNPGNITASDDTYATNPFGGIARETQGLAATNFGFSIPSGATIDGIVVEWERKGSAGAGITDTKIKLIIGGSISGNNNSAGAAWSATESYVSFGSSSDKWGLTPTDTDVNASNFGAVLTCTGSTGLTASVDHCRITVYYTAGTTADSATTLGVGIQQSQTCTVTFAAAESLGVAPTDARAATVALFASETLAAGPTLAGGTGQTIGANININAGGAAGPGASIVQTGAVIFDQILDKLTTAGIPVNVAMTFAAGVQLIVVEPPNTFDGVLTLATSHGVTLAAKSIPEVAIALAAALGMSESGGRVATGAVTLAAQEGIAVTAQQIARAAVSLGAAFALSPVADGIFRSVLIGPVGMGILEAAQFSPVGQLALVEGVTISESATGGLAAAISLGIVVAIQEQAAAVQNAMIALGATPQQAMSAAAGFQAVLAMGVRNAIVPATAFGSPLAGSVIQIISETYRIANIQDETGN